MMIYLGADHRGFKLKEKIKAWLKEWGEEYEDVGNSKYDPEDDFPNYASKVARKIQNRGGLGILLCGSGGMALAANKFKGVWAVEAWDVERARHAREDDGANVLAVSADAVDEVKLKQMIRAWLKAEVKAEEKYVRRLGKIRQLEAKNFK